MNFLRAVGAVFAQPLFQRPCAQLPPHDPHNDACSLTVKYFTGGDRGSRWTLNGSVEWGATEPPHAGPTSFEVQLRPVL